MTPAEPLAEALLRRLRAIGPLAIAYSGGADSALVLAAAVRAVGVAHVVAITAVSESLASGELDAARALADDLGARHLTVRTWELSRPGYRDNGRDRCYFCKSEVLDVLARAAGEHGYDRLATEQTLTTPAIRIVPASGPGVNAACIRPCSTLA